MATFPAAEQQIQRPGTGRRSNFYVSDEDRARIRSITTWLRNQGMTASDSLVLKASVRLVRKDAALLNAAKAAQMQDRRFKAQTGLKKKK
jgi:hypothetical protein